MHDRDDETTTKWETIENHMAKERMNEESGEAAHGKETTKIGRFVGPHGWNIDKDWVCLSQYMKVSTMIQCKIQGIAPAGMAPICKERSNSNRRRYRRRIDSCFTSF